MWITFFQTVDFLLAVTLPGSCLCQAPAAEQTLLPSWMDGCIWLLTPWGQHADSLVLHSRPSVIRPPAILSSVSFPSACPPTPTPPSAVRHVPLLLTHYSTCISLPRIAFHPTPSSSLPPLSRTRSILTTSKSLVPLPAQDPSFTSGGYQKPHQNSSPCYKYFITSFSFWKEIQR